MAYNKVRLNRLIKLLLKVDAFTKEIIDEINKEGELGDQNDDLLELVDMAYIFRVMESYLDEDLLSKVKSNIRSIAAMFCWKYLRERGINEGVKKDYIIGWIANGLPNVSSAVTEPDPFKGFDKYVEAMKFVGVPEECPAVQQGLLKFSWERLTEFLTKHTANGGSLPKEIFTQTYEIFRCDTRPRSGVILPLRSATV